jgi:uncharacterized protein YggE
VGVSTQHAVPGKAQELNSAAAEKVIAAVKALGIEAKDLVTADYTIYPQYDYQNGNAITGYNVSYTVRVTVRDLTKAGPVLDAAVQAGANFGAGIQFALEDQKAAYEKALDLAIKNAVQKAAAAAKSLGATIGAPVELTESGAGYSAAPVPMALESSARDAVQIETGRLSISASVTAVFNY